jgi:PTH1 family peptidyl-tRNA hydrolase
MNKNFKAEIAEANQPLSSNNTKLLLAKPQTFMNNSGMAVKALADYYKISLADIIIIHDELDLPLGKIKVRMGGSAAGHHGVESILKYLGDDKFVRVRLGIGNIRALGGERGSKHFNAESFVVEEFESSEKSKAKTMLKNAVHAVELILKEGIEKAQNQYN